MILIEPFGPLGVSPATGPQTNIPSIYCTTTAVGLANLSTPDPREVFNTGVASAAVRFNIDLGVDRLFDSFIFANCNALAGSTIDLFFGTSAQATYYATQSLGGAPFRLPSDDLAASNGPACFILPAPVVARYISFTVFVAAQPTPFTIGRFAMGLSWKPSLPREFGAGRPMLDTGARERLADGGLATVSGALVSGFEWTFADLNDADLAKLWGIIRRVKTTETLVLIEDPGAQTAEGFHYCTFVSLERFERNVQSKSRWVLKVEDYL